MNSRIPHRATAPVPKRAAFVRPLGSIRALLFIFVFGNFFTLLAGERPADELFFEANVYVTEGAYAEAVPLYVAALEKRPSVNLHYNLGNTYYHLGDFGKARIHWERALAMDPRHLSAADNLQLLLRELNLPEPDTNFWIHSATLLSHNQWIWIGALAFWLTLFSILGRQWKKTGWLHVPTAFGLVGFVLAGIALLLLSPARHDGIILDEGAALRIAPAPGSPIATPLRPAQRIRVMEPYGEFFRVLLEDGQEGFVQNDSFEKIR